MFFGKKAKNITKKMSLNFIYFDPLGNIFQILST